MEQYDFVGATIIGTVLLGISLTVMLLVNWVQTWVPAYPCTCNTPRRAVAAAATHPCLCVPRRFNERFKNK